MRRGETQFRSNFPPSTLRLEIHASVRSSLGMEIMSGNIRERLEKEGAPQSPAI